jgi:hypothetical protein
MKRFRVSLLTIVAFLAAPSILGQRPLHAAEETDIASALDPDDRFDAHATLTYWRRLSRGAIRRERVGRSAEQDAIGLAKELRYSRVQHVLVPRVEVGVWRDLQLHIALPVVLSDSRALDFAQNGGNPCGDPRETNCVTPTNSTLAQDGLIDGSAMQPEQVAVANRDGPAGGRLLPRRSGLDQLYLGLSWAPWNQRRDPAKPTWILGFEARIAVGSTMTYDPDNPEGNTVVGRGVHQLHFFTKVSRRFQYLDPWFSLYYMAPFARGASLFDDTTFPASGQQRSGPRHRAGLDLGVEIVPWERPEQGHRFSVELRGQLDVIFSGRGYSPAWELFAANERLQGPCHPDSANAPDLPPPWSNGAYCETKEDQIPHPGITQIENYLRATGVLAFNLRLTHYLHLRLGLALGHDQSHFITSEDPGQPKEENGKIDPRDPAQLNPLYRSVIDTPGRRLRIGESTIFDVVCSLTGMF